MTHERGGKQIEEGERGRLLNRASTFTAVHPVVRTHPVTGWKSMFSVGYLSKLINEVNQQESE